MSDSKPKSRLGCVVRAALLIVVFAAGVGAALAIYMHRDPIVTLPENPPDTVFIQNVRVIDVIKGAASESMDVTLAKGKIANIAPTGGEPPEGAKVVSGEGKSLIPGLIDIHCHVLGAVDPPWVLSLPDSDLNLERLLYSGVTRALDPGAMVPDIFELRAAVASGQTLGPTLYAAGPIFTATGGHPIPLIRQMAPSFIADTLTERMVREVDSPEAARAAVDALMVHDPDFFKVAVDSIPFDAPKITPDVGKTVIDHAAEKGRRAVAHIGTTADAKAAAEAGASAWVHGVYQERLSDADVEALAAYKIPMAPTLVVFRSYAEMGRGKFQPTPLEREIIPESTLSSFVHAPEDYTTPPNAQGFIDMLREQQSNSLDNVGRLHKAGVIIMAGSDAQSGTIHGTSLHRELDLLGQSGLPAIDILRAATLHPARFLTDSQDPDFGVVATDKIADLVLVRGNPLEHPKAISQIDAVILGGVVLDRHPIGAAAVD